MLKDEPQPWHEGSALRWWRADLRAAGIPRPAAGPRKLHCTRHTFSSLLARAGVARNVRESMTHTEQERNAADGYVHLDWRTVCAAIVKLGVSA